MITVTVQSGKQIELGHQHDNLATRVVFPSAIVNPFLTAYGEGGEFEIWFRKPGEVTGSIVDSNVTQDGTTVEWVLTSDDLSIPGLCQIQLRYNINHRNVMSQVFPGIVEDSVDIE